MKVTIEKIQIDSFGKLKNVIISANEGINLLSAPNETGKSTLAYFIKYAFYGFVGGRKHDLADNDRKLFTPWDGEICEGRIAFTADNSKYILHRRTSASGKETCEVIDRITGKPEFVGVTVGEAVFGVTEEIFTRTLFFRQLTLPQSTDEVLGDRLRDIAISADELVNTKRALKKLTDAKNELKGKAGNGLIPKAVSERDALEEEITRSESIKGECNRLQAELVKRSAIMRTDEENLKRLTAERQNMENYEALLKLQNLNRLKQAEQQAKEEYETLSAGLKKQADTADFGSLTAKNAQLIAETSNAQAQKEQLDSLKKEQEEYNCAYNTQGLSAAEITNIIASSKLKSKICISLLAVAVAATLGLMFVSLPAAIGIAAVGAASGIMGIISMQKPKKLAKKLGFNSVNELNSHLAQLPQKEQQAKLLQDKITALTQKYQSSLSACKVLKQELESEIASYTDNDESADFSQQIQKILTLSAACGEKLALWQVKKQEYDTALDGADIQALAEMAKSATKPERARSAIDMELNFYTKHLAQLTELNRKDELDLAAWDAKCGDISVLVGKRDALNNSIADYSLKHKAYEKAIELINDSGSYMKSMIAPRISARADRYFAAATDGKYNNFAVDTHVAMSFGEAQRSCEYLSAGTRDSAYLSLRLALADLLFSDGAPIVLDDAFSRLDNNRLAMMLNAVNTAAANHQVFIFSHGDREEALLKQQNINYTTTEIKEF
ncbi:MAG: hypothetical protein IKZ23_00850 [Clostridia bacterium]|nr:hypothetical protein [Clostridia bacterium]